MKESEAARFSPTAGEGGSLPRKGEGAAMSMRSEKSPSDEGGEVKGLAKRKKGDRGETLFLEESNLTYSRGIQDYLSIWSGSTRGGKAP